jgi:F-type H+-transporting ATPase subunit alpha
MKDFNSYLKSIGEIGYIEQTTSSTLLVSGLPLARPWEIVIFESGKFGQVVSINKNLVEILIFASMPPKPGTKVVRTNEIFKFPVGFDLLGNVIAPLGNLLEVTKPTKKSLKLVPIHASPSGIINRKTITRQFETGVSMVDLVTPLGHGQRELIIGDRKTGKTSFLLQSALTQTKKNNICIYAAIGSKKLSIKDLKDFFTKAHIMDKIVIIASSSEDPAGVIYLTPFVAMTVAEYFRDEGYDVLLILDDLSTHAKFYREIALLGKRFPGRNSYPGDIFYNHAALLERAGNFITKKGEKAITCLPVAQTVQGDLSGYIQTNIMSITDGHLYFDADLFAKGRRPAINPFLSVTRVGKQTQSNPQRELNREILSFLTLYEKMQSFSHFGAELSEGSKITLNVGDEVIKFFDQNTSTIIPLEIQIVLFCLLWNRIMQNQEIQDARHDIQKAIKAYQESKEVRGEIDQLVENARSFNELLGILKKKGDKVLADINKYGK